MKDNKPKMFLIIFMGLILLLGIVSVGFAQIPRTVSYQGYLTDTTTGNPVDTLPGTVSITFTIYDALTAGNVQWAETQNVSVNQGVYNVVFGADSLNPLSIFFNTHYWLGIEVGTDGEMLPRLALTSVPYAINADTVDGQHAMDLGDIQGVTAGTGLTGGGTSGDVTLDVMVPLIINGSYAGSIVSGINSGSGFGVLGLRGSFELGNRGYLGDSNYGVYGIGEIGTATGVYGRNLFSGNYGYLGGSVHGVHGESGSGIGGYFTSTTGYGLIVESGNVGIGTLNPQEKLDVEGNIFVNGTAGFNAAGEDAIVQFGHPCS